MRSLLEQALTDSERGLGNRALSATDEALDFLAEQADGDARIALNTLEVAAGLLTRAQGEGLHHP